MKIALLDMKGYLGYKSKEQKALQGNTGSLKKKI
jgi:hypothetical protein